MSDNDECHFAGTTAEWHYGKQCLKMCVLRRLRKTARDGADVTWCGKPFQTRAAATGKTRSPMVDRLTAVYGGQSSMVTRRIVDDVKRHSPWAGGVHRQGTKVLLTLVNKESELEIDSLRCHQPAQLTEKWSDMVVPRQAEH